MESYNTPRTERISNEKGQFKEVLSTLKAGNRFLIISHVRPDGDAIGSVAGLTRSLRKQGKIVEIGFLDPLPKTFEFLLAGEIIRKPETLGSEYDAILVLDTGDAPRSGFEQYLSKANILVVNIDHHSSNTYFGDLNCVEPEACSTCEMVLDIIRQGNLPLDAEVAECLYLGMLTDTMFFQTDRIRPANHYNVGFLLSTGLDTGSIFSRLNRNRSLAEMKILGLGLVKFEVSKGGKMLWFVITKEDLKNCEASLENVWSCGLFGKMTTVAGVVVGIGIVEGPDEKCYAEFRSTAGFDVKEIAVEMGGGGHLNASGCNKVMGLTDFVKEAIEKTQKKLDILSEPGVPLK